MAGGPRPQAWSAMDKKEGPFAVLPLNERTVSR
jgi:hypothetical protein